MIREVILSRRGPRNVISEELLAMEDKEPVGRNDTIASASSGKLVGVVLTRFFVGYFKIIGGAFLLILLGVMLFAFIEVYVLQNLGLGVTIPRPR